jgi:hypothetical protein
MGLKGYRLWVMGQLDSNVQSPTVPKHSWHPSPPAPSDTAPAAAAAAAAASFTAGALSSSQRIFMALKYVLMGKPEVARKCSLLSNSATSASHSALVRVSSHTTALCSGLPEVRSHAAT